MTTLTSEFLNKSILELIEIDDETSTPEQNMYKEIKMSMFASYVKEYKGNKKCNRCTQFYCLFYLLNMQPIELNTLYLELFYSNRKILVDAYSAGLCSVCSRCVCGEEIR